MVKSQTVSIPFFSVCVCVCVCACVHACMRACVRACVRLVLFCFGGGVVVANTIL